MANMKSTGRRATICMDLLNLEENLMSFSEAPQLQQLPGHHSLAAAVKLTHEGSNCQNEPCEAITDYTQPSVVVSTIGLELLVETVSAMPDSKTLLSGKPPRYSTMECPPLSSGILNGDLETLSNEKFDFEIHTPETSDSEDAPLKTLLDSPMSFREKVHAARVQLKDHNERSGTKDLDALFAMIRPDLPVTRPGSGDSAFAEPSIEELLDIHEPTTPQTSIPRPPTYGRSNSLLRRRPESFLSGSMADLVRKAQEQEKMLIEGAKETAKRYQAKRPSPPDAVTPAAAPTANYLADVSPTIAIPRLTFDASPEANSIAPTTSGMARREPAPRPSTLPRPPRHSLLPPSTTKLSTPTRLPPLPPQQPLRTDAPVTIKQPFRPAAAAVPATIKLASTLPTSSLSMPRGVTVATRNAVAAPAKPTVVVPPKPPVMLASLLAAENPPPKMTRRSISTIRVPSSLSLPKPQSRTPNAIPKPEPLRANHTLARPSLKSSSLTNPRSSASKPESERRIAFADHVMENGVLRKVTPVDSRFTLPPAMAESVARLSTPKKLSPPKEELYTPKSPSPPKTPAVVAVKRRLSFIPNVPAMSAAPALDSGSVEVRSTPRRHSMTQKALTENLPKREPACVFTGKLIDLDDEPSSMVSSGSLSSNCENLLIEL